MTKRLALIAAVAVFYIPASVLADTLPLSPGCHYSTPEEQARRSDLGIPQIYQTCPADKLYLGVGENFDQWYAQLRTQSPCNKNTCTLSCRTRNTGAQVCGPVSKQWNSISCHPNNNTAIFPTVAYGFAAHITLLRNYCGQQGRCTINAVVSKWTAVAGDRQSYADFVSRNSGIPSNQVFNPNDVDLMGRLALSMACFEAGAMPYDVNDLKQGLSMASGGPRQPMPANIGALLNESLQGSYAPNANSGTWAPMPFAGQPFMGQPSPGYGTNTTNPSNISNQYNPAGYQSTPPTGTYSPNTSQPYPDAGASSQIVVWPHKLQHKQTLTVSWTSVNMPPNSCQILFQGQQFANTNEGSKSMQTVTSDTSPLIFTLECKDSNAQLQTASDSATFTD